ncbi:uncharacterized protein LOC125212890 [Salvia hispanica]|uniref:uncharacterized protein LOC125212890 n=1 Tax=Salvia hispanica TaxID=49212 RepID=UPI002009C922|nr:uncharacterized protein LOC125212890 [Salvia hispanica]
MANHERIHLNLEVSPVENYTGVAAADDIPDDIIHHIQSFLDGRQAARTAVLLKSWHRAWCTRPDLHFRDQDFRYPLIDFPDFAINTLQRYEDLQLKIYTFRLEMVVIEDHELATELIVKAIKLGAAELKLQIRSSGQTLFTLPNELLDSETLAVLSVHGCLIDLQFGEKQVSLSSLKTLNLSYVMAYGDLFYDLVSKCTSLEKITLDTTTSYPTLDSTKIFPTRDTATRRLVPSSSCDSMIKLHKLKFLQFNRLDSRDNIYRHDLWPNFTWLKELVIWAFNSDYDYWNGISICSRSLEIISLCTYGNMIMNGKFDVPNIRKFKVVGVHVPQLVEFKTGSNKEWESDIQIKCTQFTTIWFSALSNLLRMLSPSRISLSVSMAYLDHARYTVSVGNGSPIPIVENLLISGHEQQHFSVFLTSLFRSCRPNCVSVDTRFVIQLDLEAKFQRLGYRSYGKHDLSNHQKYLAKFQRI